MVNWKQKLTSRKFWAAVAGFVGMILIALGKDASTAQTVTGIIMAGASVVGYMIGEGLADSGRQANKPVEMAWHYDVAEPEETGCTDDSCRIVYHDEEVM